MGVEIEFAGLTEDEVAEVVCDHIGGTVGSPGKFRAEITDSALGDITVVLDTALRKRADSTVAREGLDLARAVIPVEIVTQPLPVDELHLLDEICAALRAQGAEGTGNGLLQGFGVHFNVETVAPTDDFTVRSALVYGLLEDWLRSFRPLDPSRRATPFVDPWPRKFLDAIARQSLGFDDLRTAYAKHVDSRNHGLDLLPILKHVDESTFERLFPDQSNTNARPAFHFRLPDCRIDEPDWSLADEWESWWRIESVADRADLLDALLSDYDEQRGALLDRRGAWADRVAARLQDDAPDLLP